MVERSHSLREVEGSIPLFSKSTFGVVVTFLPSKEEPRFRLPEGALKKGVVAQMVERALRLREEGGSTPLNSILKFLSLINSKTYLRHLLYIFYIMIDNGKYIMQIVNISGLMGLGVFFAVGSGIILDSRPTSHIDWRDLALLGLTGSWITSWALYRQRY